MTKKMTWNPKERQICIAAIGCDHLSSWQPGFQNFIRSYEKALLQEVRFTNYPRSPCDARAPSSDRASLGESPSRGCKSTIQIPHIAWKSAMKDHWQYIQSGCDRAEEKKPCPCMLTYPLRMVGTSNEPRIERLSTIGFERVPAPQEKPRSVTSQRNGLIWACRLCYETRLPSVKRQVIDRHLFARDLCLGERGIVLCTLGKG